MSEDSNDIPAWSKLICYALIILLCGFVLGAVAEAIKINNREAPISVLVTS